MTSTNDEHRPGRHTVTRSRRAAASQKAAAKAARNSENSNNSEIIPNSAEASRPIPGSWPAAKTEPPAEPNSEQNSEQPPRRHRQPSEAELARREAVAKYPFVAVTLGSSGIHPATSRLISFDAVTYNAEGEIGEATSIVFSPDSDPGPRHQHGLTHEEVAAGIPFSKALKRVDRVVDDRTLIVHDATVTWGFLVSEARRAMASAARQNRSRNRNSRNRSRRIKVGHIPKPKDIIDTLATARRQELVITDVRLASVAIASGIPATPPKATVERAQRPAADTAREETALLWQLHKLQAARGTVVTLEPSELRADKFGLQRSHIRVDAMEAPRMHHNPGQYAPGKELVRGMEFVVAPEIAMDPDVIIEAAMREEMNYVEKISRETSVVICNITTDLVGKAMHADRKDIPLMSDEAFLAALERIEEPGPEPVVEERPTTAPRPQRRNPNSSSAPRRSSHSHTGANAGNNSGGGNTSSGKPGGKPAAKPGSNNSGHNSNADAEGTNRPQRKSSRKRRRRRGSSNPNAANQHNQSQNQDSQQSKPGQAKPPHAQPAQAKSELPKPGQNQGASPAGNNQSGSGQSGSGQGGSKSSNRRRRRGGRGGRNRNRSRNGENQAGSNRSGDGNAPSNNAISSANKNQD